MSHTLQARDYKGVGQQDITVVVSPIVIGHTRLYNGTAKNDKERIFSADGGRQH